MDNRFNMQMRFKSHSEFPVTSANNVIDTDMLLCLDKERMLQFKSQVMKQNSLMKGNVHEHVFDLIHTKYMKLVVIVRSEVALALY